MTTSKNKGAEVNNSDASWSLEDIVRMQTNLKRNIDFNKPENELTPEEFANKDIYFAMDKMLEDKLGSKSKQEVDEARDKMEFLDKFDTNLKKLIELGKEIERNLVWQFAYITNHFDKSKDNHFKVVVDGMTDNLVGKDMTPAERIEMAKKVLGIIEGYRSKVLNEMLSKQEIISALMPTYERIFRETDFKRYSAIAEDKGESIAMGNNIQEWIHLTKQIINSRKKGVEAVLEKMEIDQIIPNNIIQHKGDNTKTISGVDMRMRGDRMIKLLTEANKAEEEIEIKRTPISEGLYGKTDEYMQFPKENKEIVQKQPTAANPLQVKAWFRFFKTIYIIAYALAILLALALISESGIWFLVGVVVIFTIIKKAFYYVVLGKTNWKTS